MIENDLLLQRGIRHRVLHNGRFTLPNWICNAEQRRYTNSVNQLCSCFS